MRNKWLKDWFEVVRLPGNIFAIMEPRHFQEVISYLIVGEKAALLLDTGAGIGNIADVVRGLWAGDVVVVNSHVHFDHVGDNHRFGQVLVYNHPPALDRLRRGYSPQELAPHAKASLFAPDAMGSFDPAVYAIPPSNPAPVADGHTIDLGGRTLRVMHTPGHSPDSIVLFDDATGGLFTGDTYYPGHLYAHYQGDFYGESCLTGYVKSMNKLAALDNVKTVHPGHNRPAVPFADLQKAAKALARLHNGCADSRTLLVGDLSVASLPNRDEEIPPGYVVPNALYVYDVDGVKIIAL
jgi:glyoxylase-like metal-dependent hydrolase (beta-lactamase superfamily II)